MTDAPTESVTENTPVVSLVRARRHLIVTTPWMIFFSAAYAYSVFWAVGFIVESLVARETYYQLRDAVFTPAPLIAWWFLGVFTPAWFFFCCYGFWVRRAPKGKPLPPFIDRLFTATLVLMPWWWLMLLVKNPRLVLRNYRRRFLGETPYFMDDPGESS